MNCTPKTLTKTAKPLISNSQTITPIAPMLIIIDATTLTTFIADNAAFNAAADFRFHLLDADHDGHLTRADLKGSFDWRSAFEYEPKSDEEEAEEGKRIDDSIFDLFDADKSGTIDVVEFREMMKEFVAAAARGIGNTPLSVVVEDGSMMMKAYEHEMKNRGGEVLV
ncbi:hypothetical protein Droror1_Dr00002018 [Drosera rotundifolia]